MKREQVEALLKDAGITEDKMKAVIDTVMAENDKDIEEEKARTEAKEKELVASGDTIKGLKDTLKKYDGKDPEKLQADLEALGRKYEEDVKVAKAGTETLKKEFGLKEALRSAGVSDPDYLMFKHGGVEKFAFDGEGKPIGLTEIIAPYKESLAHLFAKPETQYTPTGGGESAAGNPWAKDTFNLTKQSELFRDNPAQAKELMAAAGVSS